MLAKLALVWEEIGRDKLRQASRGYGRQPLGSAPSAFLPGRSSRECHIAECRCLTIQLAPVDADCLAIHRALSRPCVLF